MAENTVIFKSNKYWTEYIVNRDCIGKNDKEYPVLPDNCIAVVDNVIQYNKNPIVAYVKKNNKAIKNYLMTHKNAFYELFTPLTNHYLTFDIDQYSTKKINNEEIPNPPSINIIKQYFDAFNELSEVLGVSYKFSGYSNTFESIDEFSNDKNVICFHKIQGAKKWFSAHVIFNFTAKDEQLRKLLGNKNTKWIHNDNVIDYDHSIYSFNKLLRAGFANKLEGKDITETKAPIPEDQYIDFIEQTYEEAVSDEEFNKLSQFFIIKEEPKKVIPKKVKTDDDSDDDDDDDRTKEHHSKDAFQVVVPIEIIRELLLNHYPVSSYDETLYIEDNDYFKALCCLLSSCPYKLDDIKEVLHDWYNQIHHNHPDAIDKLVDDIYKPDYENNKYYFGLLTPFKVITLQEYVMNHIDEDDDETKDNYKRYCEKLKHRPSKSLSKKDRGIKTDMEDLENDLRIAYEDEYDEYNRIYKKYKLIFDTHTLACNNGRLSSYRYNVFIDTETKRIFSIGRSGALHQQTKDTMMNYYHKFSVDNLIKIDSEELIEMNIAHKLRTTGRNSTQEDIKSANRFLEIFKKSFVNEIDYNVYIDFLRFKLNKPNEKYLYNMACCNGSGTFKTMLIQKLDGYIKQKDFSIESISQTQFNEWIKNTQLLLIDELPQNVKLADTVRQEIKRMTGEKTQLKIKNVQNTLDHKIRFNMIVNSNYDNFGGLFDNQTEDEMFRRFHIIKKQKIESKEEIKEAANILEDKMKLEALIAIIRDIPAMKEEEIEAARETQIEFHKLVKNNKITRGCIPLYALKDTIKQGSKSNKRYGYWLSISKLLSLLKEHGIITTSENERQLLISQNIIKTTSPGHHKIVDLQKYYHHYAISETPEEDEDIDNAVKALETPNEEL